MKNILNRLNVESWKRSGTIRLIQVYFLISTFVVSGVRGQQPKNVQTDGTASALLTAGFATGNKSITISGTGTLTGNGTVNLANATVTLPANVSGGNATFQPLDSDLTAIAALSTTANGRSLLTAATLTGAGLGLTNGSTIDAWGAKAVPTGTVVGTSDSQTLTNKTISGASNTLSVRIANDVTGFGTGVATALGVATNAAGGFSPIDGVATFSNKTISGSTNTLSNIANGSLTNSTISIAGASTALGGSITLDTIDNGLASTGLIARTGANTRAARTITGTANQITVTNGDGVSGNPTLSLPTAITNVDSISSETATDLILKRAGTTAFTIGSTTLTVNAAANFYFNGSNASFGTNDLTSLTIRTNGNSAIGITSGQAVSINQTLSIAGTTASTSTSTGALINSGGFGNAGAIYSGGAITAAAGGGSIFAGVAGSAQGYIRLYNGSNSGREANIYNTATGGLTLDTAANTYPITLGGSAVSVTNGITVGTNATVTKILSTTPAALTYASPTSVDVTAANVFTATTVNATGSVTFNATAGGTAGATYTFIITNDATSAKTITFGTNFLANGTLTASGASKKTTIRFISDGTSLIELCRTVLP